MQSRNSTSLFVAETEEIESGSNPVFLNMSLIIRVNITFDAVWFIGLLGIVLSDDELSTQPHTIFRMPMNSSAFLQINGCFIISTDGYSWKWDSFFSNTDWIISCSVKTPMHIIAPSLKRIEDLNDPVYQIINGKCNFIKAFMDFSVCFTVLSEVIVWRFLRWNF